MSNCHLSARFYARREAGPPADALDSALRTRVDRGPFVTEATRRLSTASQYVVLTGAQPASVIRMTHLGKYA